MNDAGPAADAGADLNRRHERSDMSIRPVVMFGVGLFVLMGVTLLAMGGVFRFFSGRQPTSDRPASSVASTRVLPPEPRLQVDPSHDLAEIRAAEDAVLKGYGWVDRKAGVVRIPVDRAMELLVERGLPVRAKAPGQD